MNFTPALLVSFAIQPIQRGLVNLIPFGMVRQSAFLTTPKIALMHHFMSFCSRGKVHAAVLRCTGNSSAEYTVKERKLNDIFVMLNFKLVGMIIQYIFFKHIFLKTYKHFNSYTELES